MLTMHFNSASMGLQKLMTSSGSLVAESTQRLSSGSQINTAADDAAGLSLSDNIEVRIQASQKNVENVQDALNMMKRADGSYQAIVDILQRMRELAVQAATDTNAAFRPSINAELNQLRTSINQVANSTNWGSIRLLSNAGVPANIFIQLGTGNNLATDRLDIRSAFGNTTVNGAGLNVPAANITTNANARTYINRITLSLNILHGRQGTLGSFMSHLESSAASSVESTIDLNAAHSRVVDADMASEASKLVRGQILQDSGTALLAQANQQANLTLALVNQSGY